MNKQNQLVTIVLYTIYFVLIYIIFSYIGIILAYKPLLKWWTDKGGKKYDKYFNIKMMISTKYNYIIYGLFKIFSSPINDLNMSSYRFIYNQLIPYINFDNTDIHGILTPKSLCDTILLSPTDDNSDSGSDLFFNRWYHVAGGATRNNGTYRVVEGVAVNSSESEKVKDINNNDAYIYRLKGITNDDGYNVIGIYPTKDNIVGWQALMLEWLGEGWCITRTTDASDIWVFSPTKDNTNGDSEWNDICKHPDNVFARYMIPIGSELILAFINDTDTIGSKIVDAHAFVSLIGGSGNIAGGWIGFLNGANKSENEYINLLHANIQYELPVPKTCNRSDNIGRGFITGGSAFLSGLSGMAFLGFTPAGFAIAGLSALNGIMTGYQAGSANKCQ